MIAVTDLKNIEISETRPLVSIPIYSCKVCTFGMSIPIEAKSNRESPQTITPTLRGTNPVGRHILPKNQLNRTFRIVST